MQYRTRRLSGAALLLALSAFSADSLARDVVVNGQQMSLAQLQLLDRVACSQVPDGAYWLDFATGRWGYQGGGLQGYIGENCRTQRRSLSERGLLYSPGELLR